MIREELEKAIHFHTIDAPLLRRLAMGRHRIYDDETRRKKHRAAAREKMRRMEDMI